VQNSGGTIVEFADRMAELALSNDIPAAAVPNAKTLTNIANLRHPPTAAAMLLVRVLTDGAIDLDQWVEDAFVIRKAPRGTSGTRKPSRSTRHRDQR
jgi:hypothetical protein